MTNKYSSIESASYEVGYGKPPAATRFQKGQSGNPSGRPKGRKNLASVLQQALQVKVPVTEAGRRRMKSKLEVAITQVVNKAASGDLRALGQVLAMHSLLADVVPDHVSPDLAADRLQAQRIMARLMSGKSTQELAGDE